MASFFSTLQTNIASIFGVKKKILQLAAGILFVLCVYYYLTSYKSLSSQHQNVSLKPQVFYAKKGVDVSKINRKKRLNLAPKHFDSFNVTVLGPNTWMEDGIIYRPRNKSFRPLPTQILDDYETFIPYDEETFFEDKPTKNITHDQKKIILWYTVANYIRGMPELTPLRSCPDFPCYMTTNRKYAKNSSLMIFDSSYRIDNEPPPRAFPDQVYMSHWMDPFHPKKPHMYLSGFHKMKNPKWLPAFNWTMMYRSDSTLPVYYGDVRRHPNPPTKDYQEIMAKKTKKVAWITSHCGAPSGRDKIPDELKKHMSVDIFGICGPHKCPRTKDEECQKLISTSYKFILGMENTLCKDYISEKFYRWMLADLVTVVYGLGPYEERAPKGSFINSADFDSPVKLAAYLSYLDKNDEEYIKILKKKDQYIYLVEDDAVRNGGGGIHFMFYMYQSVPFCRACQKLWHLDKNRHQIKDIIKWYWETEKMCK